MSAAISPRNRKLVYFTGAFNRVEAQDDGSLLVGGTVVTETPVRQLLPDGRVRPVVLDYEAAKSASERYARNLREMHQPVAVGRAITVDTKDDKRTIEMTAFVSDGAAPTQIKVRDGTLKSYSIGCDPTAWHDEGGLTRVTAFDWVETSLVDVGADPGTNDLVVLTRGAHLEPGLIGHKEALMGNTAAAAVETEAPAPTVTTIGSSEVTITAAGEATVKPLTRATEPVTPPPVVVAESTETAPPVNRFAVAMTAATQRAEEVAAKAAADCTCCGGGKCVGCDMCTCEGVGKDCACCTADSCTGCKTCTHESMTAAEKPPADGIANEADLMSAIKKSAGADDPGAEKTKIKKAAKRLGLVDKLPRTWRAVKPELLRHMVGGDPADDLSCAIGCLRSVGWISRDVEYLLASEMAEGLGGGPTEGGQVVILQGVLASLQAACAGLKEFIADEASEGAAGGAPEPAPPAAVETADEAMMEAAAKPHMIRGLVALNRRLASLEAIAKTPASVPAFTSADAEQLATAMGQVFGSTTAPLSRALGDLGNEVKAVREELDQVLKLPKPYGVARGVQQQRNVGQASLTGDVQPAAKLAVLRDLASRTNNPVSLGEIQVEINRAEALLKGNPG